jgi:hypothetical protein
MDGLRKMGLVREEIDRHVVPLLSSVFTMYAWNVKRPEP